MRCYLISNDQVIALAAVPASVTAKQVLVRSANDLDVKRFPVARLLALHNELRGASPIKRAVNRPALLKRFWAAIEALPIGSGRANSKQARVIAMLNRPEGASRDALMKATGWKAHSVRGVLSGVIRKKLGLKLVVAKDKDQRIYRIVK